MANLNLKMVLSSDQEEEKSGSNECRRNSFSSQQQQHAEGNYYSRKRSSHVHCTPWTWVGKYITKKATESRYSIIIIIISSVPPSPPGKCRSLSHIFLHYVSTSWLFTTSNSTTIQLEITNNQQKTTSHGGNRMESKGELINSLAKKYRVPVLLDAEEGEEKKWLATGILFPPLDP